MDFTKCEDKKNKIIDLKKKEDLFPKIIEVPYLMRMGQKNMKSGIKMVNV